MGLGPFLSSSIPGIFLAEREAEMARILKVQHWKPEFGYNDEGFFLRRGDLTDNLLLFAGEKPPDPRLYDLAIVYGGYMSAYDEAGNPWIADELRFLEGCLKADTPVFGICLGSQLLARLLGARVFRSSAPEFGFKKVWLNEAGATDPVLGAIGDTRGSFLAIQWHDDAWDLPAGSELLASSETWPNQAFRYGPHVLAIQFHLEFTQPHMAWAVARPGESESEDPGKEDSTAFAAPSPRYDEIRTSMEKVLSRILAIRDVGAGARSQGAVELSRAVR
jgi:GMP synthase-like glutamine amidotransferase